MASIRESNQEPMVQTARRAEIVSLSGLFLQLVFFAVLLLVSLWNGSQATFVASFYLLGGVIIWLGILLIYHQEKLVHVEALEAEQIDRDREAIGAEALFDEGRAGVDSLLVAKTRLQWMVRWLVPILGVLTSIYLIAMGVGLWKWYLTYSIGSEEWPRVANASVSLGFVGGVAFLSFLFSRYAVGMARIGPMWRMMRAGGSYLTGNALICGLAAAMLGFVAYGKPVPEQVFAKIIPIVMVVIGLEFVVNLLLETYRPRKPGEVPRPAFDSRLFGLISEPGGIARTIADAVNYQFGFEVSKTWFYQLLERWVLVLVGAAVLVLFLMTCVVIVEPGQQAVIERFGRPVGLKAGKFQALGPGIHFKLPWPIDRAARYEVQRVQSLVLGFGPWKRRNPPETKGEPNLILWTNPVHGPGEELDFVLPVRAEIARAVSSSRPAVSSQPGTEGPRTPAVNLLRMGLSVMYTVRDLYPYAFSYSDPETLIQSAAYGELVKYVADKDLDEMLAVERNKAAQDLQQLIQAKCDALNVGVNIVFVGLENIHPPQTVASEFEDYLNAKYEAGAAIEKANGEANKILTESVGSRARAEELAALIVRKQELTTQEAPQAEISEVDSKLEELFYGRPGGEGVSGEAAQIVAAARADRWLRENEARARAVGFVNELKAYRSAPRLYRMRKIVEALMTGLVDASKYVVARKGDLFTRYDATEKEQVRLEDVEYNVPPG